MGNAGSNIPRERHKSSSSDIIPSSPNKDGQQFGYEKYPMIYEKKPLLFGGVSHDEEEPYYTKPLNHDPEFMQEPRQRANTLDEATAKSKESASTPPALPTVFKWDGGGKQVFISGTFSEWKTLPMVKSHGDFVTIIDLPEGDHQYKFCVDGEWRHDPKLVIYNVYYLLFLCNNAFPTKEYKKCLLQQNFVCL